MSIASWLKSKVDSLYAMIGILLAAGFSTRFGNENKLLAPLQDGESIGYKAGKNLIQAIPQSVAVVRHEHAPLAKALESLGFIIASCEDDCRLMAQSLALGIQTALRHFSPYLTRQGWVIGLGDMPDIHPTTIRMVVSHIQQGAFMAAPKYEGQRGHPVGFSGQLTAALQSLSGDEGAKALLQKYRDQLVLFDCEDAGVLVDIDTPADLGAFNTTGSHRKA